ncbi:MAG: transposase [Aggregatilineaceae bacterium]
MQFLATLPVKYVIRARKNTLVRYRRRFTGLLSDIPIRRGQLLWWPRTLYHQEAAYPVNLAISWNNAADQPWYLLTNLRRSDTTVHWYERRFRCEELFKDIKDQLHLETVQLKKQERVERLIFALMVAYYALTLIGVAAQNAGLRPKVCRHPVSPAWMALRLLKMPFIFKPRLARRALFFYSWSLNYETG